MIKRAIISLSLVVTSQVAFAQAPSSEPTATPPAAPPGPIQLGVQAGAIFPQLQSELGSSAAAELEVGYRVAAGLAILGAVGYTQPKAETNQDDPRLPAGSYMTTTDQRELTISVGGMWRFLPAHAKLNGYAGLAARVWLLETKTIGTAGGESFLENQETSTRYGGALFGGAELRVGPGAALFEIDLGGSDLPHLITGDVATTALSLSLGYRLFL